MDLSIVIPVLNEEKKVAQDILFALHFLKQQKLQGEIIVVDDGSIDNTADVICRFTADFPGKIRLISYHPNKGKGYAVKKGILDAKGEFILFADSGSCVPFDNALKGIDLIKKNNADLAHGSRFLPESKIIIPRKRHRSLFSFLFRKFVSIYSQLPGGLSDTQCGFKLYKKQVAHQLYSACQTRGFMFDIEIILLAQKYGYTIREFPIEWTTDYDSRIQLSKTFFRMIKELKDIKKHLKIVRTDY